MSKVTGPHFRETEIRTDGRWLPSPKHCHVTRELCSYQTRLDVFIPLLLEVAEGLEEPSFTGVWTECDQDYVWAVEGFRLMTEDDETEAMANARWKRERDLQELAALKAKYEPETMQSAASPES